MGLIVGRPGQINQIVRTAVRFTVSLRTRAKCPEMGGSLGRTLFCTALRLVCEHGMRAHASHALVTDGVIRVSHHSSRVRSLLTDGAGAPRFAPQARGVLVRSSRDTVDEPRLCAQASKYVGVRGGEESGGAQHHDTRAVCDTSVSDVACDAFLLTCLHTYLRAHVPTY